MVKSKPPRKFFIAFALIATVAMLFEVLGVNPSPISVSPAIVETNPISVGPAIIDFPLPDGGAVTEEHGIITPTPVVEPVVPSPVVIGDIPAGATPLVQIIVNVNGQENSDVVPAPVDNEVVEDEVIVPGPVNIVDNVDPVIVEPINVVGSVIPIVVEPVNVVEPVIPVPVEPVNGVEPVIPVPVEPVNVAEPICISNISNNCRYY